MARNMVLTTYLHWLVVSTPLKKMFQTTNQSMYWIYWILNFLLISSATFGRNHLPAPVPTKFAASGSSMDC
jgi:hypothetical protein